MEVRRTYYQGKGSPLRDRAGRQRDVMLAEEGVDSLVGLEVRDLGEAPCADKMTPLLSLYVMQRALQGHPLEIMLPFHQL